MRGGAPVCVCVCMSLATASSVTVFDYACTAAQSDLVHHSWSDNNYEMMTIYSKYRFEVHGYTDSMRILTL